MEQRVCRTGTEKVGDGEGIFDKPFVAQGRVTISAHSPGRDFFSPSFFLFFIPFFLFLLLLFFFFFFKEGLVWRTLSSSIEGFALDLSLRV